ncbi:MAG: anti-sigma factor domain-containing protein [Peptococcaceae bacterium]|nr:anti-sigma factor domain-containing protein [Peptococcaceae bacterium]
MTGRAVVLEVKGGTCTVLTAEGEFRRLKLRGNYRPGQEITIPDAGWRSSRVALVAACLLLFFLATALWRAVMVPAVASYVSLDINPSVELALDDKNIVCGVKPLDEDGKELISGLELNGLTLENTLDQIITTAIDKNYIQPEDENIILFTVIPVDGRDPAPVDNLVKESINAPLKLKKVQAQVVVGNATPEIREEAEKAGISPGRYMLFQSVAKKDVSIKPEEFRGKSIDSIEKEHKIKIKDTIEKDWGSWKNGSKNSSRESFGSSGGDFSKTGRNGNRDNIDQDAGKKQLMNPPGKGWPGRQENDRKIQRKDAYDEDKDKDDGDDDTEKKSKKVRPAPNRIRKD